MNHLLVLFNPNSAFPFTSPIIQWVVILCRVSGLVGVILSLIVAGVQGSIQKP